MDAFRFFNFLISTFSLPLISNSYFYSNGSLTNENILSKSGRCFFIKFNKKLVFPNHVPPIIKIL